MKMRLRFGLLLILMLVGMRLGAQEFSPEDKALKTQLNKSWNLVARAIAHKDYAAFAAVTDSSRVSAEEAITEKTFPRYATFVGRIFQVDRLLDPKLTPVAIRKNTHWAAYYSYYVDSDSPQQSSMALDMVVFRYVNGGWKMSLPQYGSTFPKKPTEEANKKEALRLIEADKNFHLPADK